VQCKFMEDPIRFYLSFYPNLSAIIELARSAQGHSTKQRENICEVVHANFGGEPEMSSSRDIENIIRRRWHPIATSFSAR